MTKNNWLKLLIALVILGLSFTPLRIVSLIACIVLWAMYWPFTRWARSFIFRLVLAFILTTCLQQLVGFAFWVLHVHFTTPYIVAIEMALPAYMFKRGTPIESVFVKEDVAAGLISIASMIFLAWGALHGGPILQQLVRQSTTGYDGVQHISLTLSLYDNKGYEYGQFEKLANKIIFNNLSSYPQGWSLSTSIWWHSLPTDINIQSHPTKVLFLYFSFLTLWFGLLIYLFARLVLNLVEVIRGAPNTWPELLGGVVFTMLAEVMVLIGVPSNSFVSFYPALVFPIALTFFIIELLLSPRNKAELTKFIVGGLLLSGGVAFSWLLAAPALYLMVLIALIIYFEGSFKSGISWLFRKPLLLVTCLILLALASGQGWVQLLYGVKGLVNYTGTAGVLHNLVLFTLLASTITAVALIKNNAFKGTFVSALSGIFIMSGLVYLYQIATVEQANYFSTKITFVAFTLLAVFSFALIIVAVSDYISLSHGLAVKSLFILGIALFIPVASGMDLSTSDKNGIGPINYMEGKRYLSEYSASQVSGLIAQKKIYNTNFVMYKQLGYAEDIITTHFVQMLSRNAIPNCGQRIMGDLISSWHLDPKVVTKCASGKDFYIISSNLNYYKLKQQFASFHNIKVVLSN